MGCCDCRGTRQKARKGDVPAIAELANRIEGKACQSVEVNVNANLDLVKRLERGRKRLLEGMTNAEIEQKISELEQLNQELFANAITERWYCHLRAQNSGDSGQM